MTPDDRSPYLRPIRLPLIGACLLLVWDAVVSGSFLSSTLICPIWFLFSLIKAIAQRPGWKLGLSRVLVPVITLGFVFSYAALQSRIATANAERIITACEEFRRVFGRYPSRLEELTAQYLRSVPRAKYSLMYGDFRYWDPEGRRRLMWTIVPPFGRQVYDFEHREWHAFD
jgi:hypothetical protein